jgi:UDP-glucose 4-epimerase
MHKHNVNRIIFASSRSVYGDAQFSPITEEHPTNPLSPYARTKVFMESILKDLHEQYGLEYVALRFVNAVGAMPEYGVGENHDPETHVFPLVMRAAKYNKVFNIYGTDHATADGTCVRSYIHVHDIAQANYLALEYLKKGGKSGVIQLGSSFVLSIKQMIKAVENYYHTTINIVVLPKRFADSPELISDYSKARSVLGWEPYYSTLDNIIVSADEYDNLQNQAKEEGHE